MQSLFTKTHRTLRSNIHRKVPVARGSTGLQPYWVAMAELSSQNQHREQSVKYYQRAIGLTEDPSVVLFLNKKMQHLTEKKSI